jgi:hypothetical protein
MKYLMLLGLALVSQVCLANSQCHSSIQSFSDNLIEYKKQYDYQAMIAVYEEHTERIQRVCNAGSKSGCIKTLKDLNKESTTWSFSLSRNQRQRIQQQIITTYATCNG